MVVEQYTAVAAMGLKQPAAEIGMDCFEIAVASVAYCLAAGKAVEAPVLVEKLVDSGTGFLKLVVGLEPADLVSRTDSTRSR